MYILEDVTRILDNMDCRPFYLLTITYRILKLFKIKFKFVCTITLVAILLPRDIIEGAMPSAVYNILSRPRLNGWYICLLTAWLMGLKDIKLFIDLIKCNNINDVEQVSYWYILQTRYVNIKTCAWITACVYQLDYIKTFVYCYLQ